MTPPLRVDPIKCTGHGLCAELLPELIWLDEWGYPVIEDRPLTAELEPLARRAVAACPTLALALADAGAARNGDARHDSRSRPDLTRS
jgi:ferredoxin